MKFDVSPRMRSLTTTVPDIPPKYEKYRLSGSTAEFTQGPFGFFLWQHLQHPLFTISEQRFWIGKRVRLYPNIDSHCVAINCMLAGEVTCLLRGSGKVTLKANEYAMFYVPPGIMHLAYFNKGVYETIDFELSEEYVRFFIEDHPELRAIHEYLVRKEENGMLMDFKKINIEVREQITKIRDSQHTDAGRKTFLLNRINDILLQYLKDLGQTPVTNTDAQARNSKLVESIATYIKLNLGRQLTVKRLAAENHIHIAALERAFKKVYGKTVGEFIQELRLDGARELLANSVLPIYEIAEQLGFVDLPHFSKSFKQRFALTPSEYRGNSKTATDKGLE